MNDERGGGMSGFGGPQPSGPTGHPHFPSGTAGQPPVGGCPTFGTQQPAWPAHPGQGGQPPFGGQPPYPGQPGFSGPPPQQAPNNNKTLLIVVIAIVGVLILAVVGVIAAILLTGSSDAEAAYEECCLQETTGTPTEVGTRMGFTSPSDGIQVAEWDGWSASWTYHPDAGLNVTFTSE